MGGPNGTASNLKRNGRAKQEVLSERKTAEEVATFRRDRLKKFKSGYVGSIRSKFRYRGESNDPLEKN